MLIMEALAERLSEPPLRELPVGRVEIAFSPDAVVDLLAELNAEKYTVRNTGIHRYAAYNKGHKFGFRFKMDGRLAGKSFMLRMKK
jgi:hypothetical protein